MGIRGLSSFFDQNYEISKPHNLQNTRLVIDGTNLQHFLYFNSNLSLVYGGEYEKYGRLLRGFFNNLRESNIEPIVILDGGMDPTDRKLPVILERMKDRIQKAHHISKLGETNDRLLPFLCSNVLSEVLKDEGVLVFQSEFEADEEIAAVANYYQCPILSNDSDFYLYDIVGGFVRLDSLQNEVFRGDGTQTPYMPCQIYFIESFLSHFPGIQKEVLPLFGTILGNDYIRADTFNNFFGTIRLPKHQTKRLRVSPRHAKMIGLLSWLEHKTFDDVLERVVRCVKQDNREFVLEITREVADNYNQVTSVLLGYIIDPTRTEPCLENPKVITKGGKKLPPWLLSKMHNVDISSLVLNVLCNRRLTLSPMINEPSSASSHVCSRKIRLAYYKLVLSIEQCDCVVREYDRKDWNLAHNSMEVTYDASIPNLTELPNLSSESKKLYLLNCFESADMDLSDVPPTLQLPMIVLNYFLKNTSLPYNEGFVSSLICCYIILGIARPLKYKDQKYLRGLTYKEVKDADVGFSKFFHKPKHNNARVYLVDIVHRFSEYQACFKLAYNMNKLFDKPLVQPMVSECLSGTFVYNLTAVTRTRSSPDLFVSEHVGRGSTLDALYHSLKQLVRQTDTDQNTQSTVPQSLPKPRRHKHKGRTYYPPGNKFKVLNYAS